MLVWRRYCFKITMFDRRFQMQKLKGWRADLVVENNDCSYRDVGIVPRTHMRFTSICNSRSRTYNALVWFPRVLSMPVVDDHTCRWDTCTQKSNKKSQGNEFYNITNSCSIKTQHAWQRNLVVCGRVPEDIDTGVLYCLFHLPNASIINKAKLC